MSPCNDRPTEGSEGQAPTDIQDKDTAQEILERILLKKSRTKGGIPLTIEEKELIELAKEVKRGREELQKEIERSGEEFRLFMEEAGEMPKREMEMMEAMEKAVQEIERMTMEARERAIARRAETLKFNECAKGREERTQHTNEKYEKEMTEMREQMQKIQEALEKNRKEIAQHMWRAKEEIQKWLFEHITREIKGLSSWITAQLENVKTMIARETEENRRIPKEIHQSHREPQKRNSKTTYVQSRTI